MIKTENNFNNYYITPAISKNILEFYKNRPVLVTGGAGFIGSELVKYLVKAGANITVLDNLSTGNINNIKDIINKINFVKACITDFNTCLKLTENKKIIFHMAALTCAPESINNPHLYNIINTQGTLNLLEASRINNIESFLFSSSAAVYGSQENICQENNICSPISPYGYSKLIAEYYCKQYSQIFNINTIIMRYFNVFNPTNYIINPGVIKNFVYSLENNLPITIFGDGTQTRDFVPLTNIILANLKLAILANKYNYKSEIFNIATGKSITLLDLFNKLKTNYPDYNNNIIFKNSKSGDIKYSQADCTKYFSI